MIVQMQLLMIAAVLVLLSLALKQFKSRLARLEADVTAEPEAAPAEPDPQMPETDDTPQASPLIVASSSERVHGAITEVSRQLENVRAMLDSIDERTAEALDLHVERRLLPHIESLLRQVNHLLLHPPVPDDLPTALLSLHVTLRDLTTSIALEEIAPAPGTAFHPARHRVVQTPPAPLDLTSAAVEGVAWPGWLHRDTGTVLRPAEVMVGPATPPIPEGADSHGQDEEHRRSD